MLNSAVINLRNRQEGFQQQQVSIDFDGSSEFLANTTLDSTIGIANVWSVGYWWKPNRLTALEQIVNIQSGVANAIQTQLVGTIANDPIRITTTSSGGSAIKDFRWDSLVTTGAWFLTVYTWDGTTLSLIHNGVDQGVPDDPFTDNPGTMADTARDVGVGAQTGGSQAFQGRIYSVGVWDVALSAAEANTLFNGGNGAEVDWSSDSGSYASSADLQHWWRLGFDSADIGADSGTATTLINIGDDAQNITSDDIVSDFPGA